MRTAIFIDLPNFYSRLLKSGLGESRELRDYFLGWLDLDLLAKWLGGESTPTWVFYSARRIGSKADRVEGPHLKSYVERINKLRGVTALDVEIPGEQREPFQMQCDNCHTQVSAQWDSEKGIDASLIVHLFDTCEGWDRAILLSGDADFTPAVHSLRKRGKLISGAGFNGASKALLRELYEYTNLGEKFIRDDFAAYKLFGSGKVVEKWLTAPVDNVDTGGGKMQFIVQVRWAPPHSDRGQLFRDGKVVLRDGTRSVLFSHSGNGDVAPRMAILDEFGKQFPEHRFDERHMQLDQDNWEAVTRRLEILMRKFKGTGNFDIGGLEMCYDKTEDGSGRVSDTGNLERFL